MMKDRSKIFERVSEIICDRFGVDSSEVSEDSNLGNDLGLDGLDGIELIMAIEAEYSISIPDDVFGDEGIHTLTVRMIVDHLVSVLS